MATVLVTDILMTTHNSAHRKQAMESQPECTYFRLIFPMITMHTVGEKKKS